MTQKHHVYMTKDGRISLAGATKTPIRFGKRRMCRQMDFPSLLVHGSCHVRSMCKQLMRELVSSCRHATLWCEHPPQPMHACQAVAQAQGGGGTHQR